MKRVLLIIVMLSACLAACLAAGCGNKAAELYDTAQFEELQHNKDHAIRLYEEIERRYPDSEQAKKASNRLSALKEGKK